eukprot:EG_transcript_33668
MSDSPATNPTTSPASTPTELQAFETFQGRLMANDTIMRCGGCGKLNQVNLDERLQGFYKTCDVCHGEDTFLAPLNDGEEGFKRFCLNCETFERVDVRGVPFRTPDFQPREWYEVCQNCFREFTVLLPLKEEGERRLFYKKRCLDCQYEEDCDENGHTIFHRERGTQTERRYGPRPWGETGEGLSGP